jgi:hypothetical protein
MFNILLAESRLIEIILFCHFLISSNHANIAFCLDCQKFIGNKSEFTQKKYENNSNPKLKNSYTGEIEATYMDSAIGIFPGCGFMRHRLRYH